MQKYNSRSEVPEEFKWDLTPFFKNEEEFNNTFDKCNELVNELKDYVGCTKDANRLYEFLIIFNFCTLKGLINSPFIFRLSFCTSYVILMKIDKK